LSQQTAEPPNGVEIGPAPSGQASEPATEDNDVAPALGSTSELLAQIQGIESAIRDLIGELRRQAGVPPDNNEIRHLRAQEEMVRWAFWMFIVAGLSVVVTAVGVELVRRTLKATRSAAEYAGIAADAGRAMNEIAERTRVDSSRAWIKIAEVSSFNIFQIVGDRPYVSVNVMIKNVGRTIATDIQYEILPLDGHKKIEDLRSEIIPRISNKLTAPTYGALALFPEEEVIFQAFQKGTADYLKVALPNVNVRYILVVFYKSSVARHKHWTATVLRFSARGPWAETFEHGVSVFEPKSSNVVFVRSNEFDLVGEEPAT
jgi:hypothetical protein